MNRPEKVRHVLQKATILVAILFAVAPEAFSQESVDRGSIRSGHDSSVPLDCLIEPWSDVTVSAAIEGLVDEFLVERGDRVKKGQAVARLESSLERAAAQAAEARATSLGRVESSDARLEFAARELERRKSLSQKNVVSDSAMDEALSSERVARADLQVARDDHEITQHEFARASALLERRTIRSPVDGIVVKRLLEPGEYADPPQIVHIAQIDPLRVEIFAPLSHFGKIEVGMKAIVMPEEPVGGKYEALVVVVDPVIDAASGTFGVRLELPNPDYALPAGLNCGALFPATP